MPTLTVYYRSLAAAQDEAGAVSKELSPGHTYVGLRGDDNEEEFYGFYKPDGIPIGVGKLASQEEKAMHENVKFLSEKDNNDYIFAKQIQLSKEQYDKAITFTRDRAAKDNFYVLGLDDCVDFVQSVYNAAGLPLHFTQIYSTEELSKLPNLASYKMKLKYDAAQPGLINVKGFTKGQLASDLNIPVDRLEPVVNQGLYDETDVRQTFQIHLKETDFLPKNRIKTILPREKSDQLPSSSQIPLQQRDRDQYNALLEKLLSLGLGRSSQSSGNLQKLNRLHEKLKELISKHNSAAQNVLRDFVNDKNKTSELEQQNSIAEMNNEIQQLIDSVESYNQSTLAQKQAELNVETQARIAQAKANAAITYSTIPQTITITNADIAARKQSEYESMVENYKRSCENQIESIRARSQQQRTQRFEAGKHEISNKIEAIKAEANQFSQELSSEVQDASEKISRGDDVDVDAVIQKLDVKASGFLQSIKQMAK